MRRADVVGPSDCPSKEAGVGSAKRDESKAGVPSVGRTVGPTLIRRDAGFSLATLIVLASVASILLAASIPAYQMRAQREREEELIFRGEEYVRAIQKYQRKYNINPPTIDALLNTDGIRFVRRQYKDPITGEDFRIITVNPDGSVVGSNTLNLAAGTPLNLGNSSARFTPEGCTS